MYDQAERFDAHIQIDEEFVAVLDVADRGLRYSLFFIIVTPS
jgi:hypothetical protein